MNHTLIYHRLVLILILAVLSRVIDGDTIKVLTNSKVETIRMLCIDTPERGEAGFKEATNHLRSLLKKAKIFIETDGSRDKYGRLLAYVIEKKGKTKNLNVEMVRAGHSIYWTKYGKSIKYHKEFKKAEYEAQSRKTGIWKNRQKKD